MISFVRTLLILTASCGLPTCGVAQSLSSIHRGKYSVKQGTGVRLPISERDFQTLSSATDVQVNLIGTERSVRKWQFGIITDNLQHQAGIYAPLSAPPGEYHLRIETIDRNRRIDGAEVAVTVEKVAFPLGEIPVVLLNGFQVQQFPGPPVSCPVTDVSMTFGILPDLLRGIQSPWAFFDNCAECPNCSIEDLGAQLESVLNSLQYADGTSVPLFDVIAHSMGGLIVRSYLSGKLNVPQPGVFAPPAEVKIRKAVFISTPQSGAFLAAYALTSLQGTEMAPGSQFLWDLATWNDFGDDLRGVDAMDVVGNAGTDLNPGDSDGVVDITSAVGILFPAQRVRVVPYCHVNPSDVNKLTYLLSLASGRENNPLCDPNALPIAEVKDENHETWQIIHSFLTDTDGWQNVGTSPGDDPVLSNYLGLCLSWRDMNGIPLLISSASLYSGANALAAGPSAFFCNSFVPPGTSQFQVVFSDGTQLTSSSLSFNQLGTYTAWVVKPGPIALHVTSDVYGGPGFGVASGSAITINGVNLTDASGSVAVSANGSPLTISAASPTDVRAELPSSLSGLVKLTISTSEGSNDINVLATPAASVPSMALSSSELQFAYTSGGSLPQPQSITISNIGGGTLSWSAKTNVSWITISSSSNSLSVSVNPKGFAPNVYTGTISIAAVGAGNSPRSVPVTLKVNASGTSSSVIVSAVANSASGASGAIAPGEMVTIYGSGLGPTNGVSFTVDPNTGRVASSLASTQVFFGTLAAPVLYTSWGQVNTIVPYEVAGKSQIVMEVSYQGVKSAGTTLRVARAAPGAFSVSGGGLGQAVAVNQDGTLNGSSNPAAPASYVTLYFTGGGQTNPPGVAGTINGSALKTFTQGVSVSVAGQTQTVTFDGAAPTLLDGVGQINVRLSVNTPSGPAEPLVITVGGISGPATTTLAVQAPAMLNLQGLTLGSTSLTGGNSTTATVSISGIAPLGGVNVGLMSNNPNAQVPKTVSIGVGQSSAVFMVTTTAVSSPQTVTITASLGTTTQTAVLTIAPSSGPSLLGVSFTIDGTLNISDQNIGIEIQALAEGGDVYLVTFLQLSNLFPVSITLLLDGVTATGSGNSITFSGPVTAGLYINGANFYTIDSATLVVTASATNGSAATGTLSLSTSNGVIKGKLTGTLSGIQ